MSQPHPRPDQAPVSNPVGRQQDRYPSPPPTADAQWQGGAQAPPSTPPPAPGPDAQWNAPPQRPDQYSQPQQYAQPSPYAQGPQQGSAEQYQQGAPQQYQNPQAQQYQQGRQYQQGPQQQAQQYPPNGLGPALEDVPLRRAKKAPGSGWRRAVHHMSGGAINPGMSAEEMRLQELVARIRQPVRGDYRIATLSLKGGVGKTTTTMGIGSIFASIRGDRVIAVDANPDFGTLSQRVPLQTRSSVRDLLLDQSLISYGDVRRHTSQATSRLEVLASERDPAASESFSEDEYRQVLRVLQRFYNIILTDCGTGLMHSAMAGVLDLAHSLVLISSSAIDGARSAAATLDWLSLHGHDHLVRNAVVVINLPREGSPNVAIQHLREYFLARCRAVHVIPYDPHLAEGAEIDLARLGKNTKRALVELAATVADDFATDHRRLTGY
ncbi:AAA family ATPase [Nocardia sp. NPDC052254]|uniref:MinD/ParA family ATP-binding protein n=1 Tax=Nocardia sp. NPDC052254 TaxID=3155681 RepID=UPI00342988D6